jgi:beta-xylosidase
MNKFSLFFLFILISNFSFSQQKNSSVWVADNGDGTYKNPIINSDYSDPDVIRVGYKYYLTASSFNCIPGLPILESSDLLNWKIIGYGISKLTPETVFEKPQHGNGVWAPCIRFHNNSFYIYYPDPDFGIFMIKSNNAKGPWSNPILVKSGKGLIDPTPLWDDNGKVYLIYAFAGSRAGIKSRLVACTMNSEGTLSNNDEVLIIDGHPDESTIEGPKIYKRNGYYYIFAPAGGVSIGWQTVLRSKNIYGPYEKKKVLDQGNSSINGPHQGAWVQTQTGEDWFFHFQDKGAFGRVVHLEPMKWINDWPFIGVDTNGDGVGEPVATYKKPNVGKEFPKVYLNDSDEFNSPQLGLQWQWHANSQITWGFPSSLGYFQLNCIPKPKEAINLFDIPNLLLQKFPSDEFTATTKLTFNPRFDDEEAGLVILGIDYSYLKLKQSGGKIYISQNNCKKADKKELEIESDVVLLNNNTIFLQVQVEKNGNCQFRFSDDGISFRSIGMPFKAKEGKWIGSKIGFVALRNGFINDAGSMNIDWIRFNK